MSIYKPSNLSPDFDEILFEKFNYDDSGDIDFKITDSSSPYYECYKKWERSQEIILNKSINFSFQVNSNKSKIRGYKLDILKSYIDYLDEDECLIGSIYKNFEFPYTDGDIVKINITMKDLIYNNIFIQSGQNYKWRIRLYEDVLPLYILNDNIFYEIWDHDTNETNDQEKYLNLNNRTLRVDGDDVPFDELYDKYGIVVVEDIFSVNVNEQTEGIKTSKFVFNNIAPNTPVLIYSNSNNSDNLTTINFFEKSQLGDDIEQKRIEINGGLNYIENIDVCNNQILWTNSSVLYDAVLIYFSGEKYIKGYTLMGQGELSGSEKDVVWIDKQNSEIITENFLELKFYSDYFFNVNDPVYIDQDNYNPKKNSNNSNFYPFNNIEQSYHSSDDKKFLTNLHITTNKYPKDPQTQYIIGWNGLALIKNLIQEYNNRSDSDYPGSDFQEYIEIKNLKYSYVEKWYIQDEMMNKDFLKFLSDGNMWVKLNLDSEIFGNIRLANNKLLDFLQFAGYNDYKKITSSGYDEHGFYIGINAVEGLFGCIFSEYSDKFIRHTGGTSSSKRRVSLNDTGVYVNDLLGRMDDIDIWKDDLKIMFQEYNQSFSLMYKQRERIFSIDKSVGESNLTKIVLYNPMNFSKYAYGDRDTDIINQENNVQIISEDDQYRSICCTNMLSDKFTENNIYIISNDNSIKSGESYIYIYYFDIDKKPKMNNEPDPETGIISEKEYQESELKNFAIKISSYDQKTGSLVLERGLGFIPNTKWKYQIFNVSSKCYGENNNISYTYGISTFSEDEVRYLGSPLLKNYELIKTNNIGFNINKILTNKAEKEEGNFALEPFNFFIDPNSALKLDAYKPITLELFNDAGKAKIFLSLSQIYNDSYIENFNKYKKYIIDKLDNEQWFLTINPNFFIYNNLVQLSNNYSGGLNLSGIPQTIPSDERENDESIINFGRISSSPLDDFTNPGTKFKIYSNFVDSDYEGYIITRAKKNIDMYISDKNNNNKEYLNNSEYKIFNKSNNFKLTSSIKDFNYEYKNYLTQNLTKIKFYKYIIKNELNEIVLETEELYDQNFSLNINRLLNGKYIALFIIEDEFGKQFSGEFKFQLNYIDQNPINLFPEMDCLNQRVKLNIFKNKNLNSLPDFIDIEIYKQGYLEKTYKQTGTINNFKINKMHENYIYDYNVASDFKFKYMIIVKNQDGEAEIYNSDYITPHWSNWTVSDVKYDMNNKIFMLEDSFSFNSNIGFGKFNNNIIIDKYESYGGYNNISFQQQKYKSGFFQGLLSEIKYIQGKYMLTDDFQKYNNWKKFITNKKAKLIKDPKGNVILVAVADSPNKFIHFKSNQMPTDINFSWQEIEDISNTLILSWDYDQTDVLINKNSTADMDAQHVKKI